MTANDPIEIDIAETRLIVRYPPGLRVVSSALWRGGVCEATAILNQRVDAAYSSSEPEADLLRSIRAYGLNPERTVGLLTAAQVGEAGVVEASGPCFRLWAIVTAGVGNAVRAGRALRTYPAYTPGTINTIVVIDTKMAEAALVNAVLTATEAKAAALSDMGVTDEQGLIATGTTTDAVVIACTNVPDYPHVHRYAGSATQLGDALARGVYEATRLAVERERVRKRPKGGDK